MSKDASAAAALSHPADSSIEVQVSDDIVQGVLLRHSNNGPAFFSFGIFERKNS
jgi:hypothetical protein